MMKKDIYFRVVGMNYIETDVELFVGDIVELRAEPKNIYDAEAIKVLKTNDVSTPKSIQEFLND